MTKEEIRQRVIKLRKKHKKVDDREGLLFSEMIKTNKGAELAAWIFLLRWVEGYEKQPEEKEDGMQKG